MRSIGKLNANEEFDLKGSGIVMRDRCWDGVKGSRYYQRVCVGFFKLVLFDPLIEPLYSQDLSNTNIF